MDKKSSMSRIERQKREKVLRFSIRKYSFGAASVAVAALMFLGARVASADSVTPVDQPHVEALTQDTSPLASQAKEEPTSSVKADTTVASQLVTQLKDQLKVKETAKTDLLVVAKEELVKAEQTLADSKVSQEEVDALVARLTNVLDQLRAVETPQVKEDKNGESTQEATPEIKPEVVKPTSEISAKSEETSENTNAEQLEKAKASLKVSIDRLEQAIAQTPENDLTREILEKANAQVAVAKSAFGGVEVSLRDVEDMNRVIKRNESSVMIARNRLTSGHNDVRNGAAIPVGTTLRADAGATYDNAVGLYFTKEGDGSGYPAGTMLFRNRNQNTADNQKVKDVKDVVKVDVTKNGDTYDWVIEFEANPENHKNAHAWFTIPNGHTLVNDGSASFSSYWGGSGGKRRIDTQGRLPRNLNQIFENQITATSKAVNFGTPGGAIEKAWGKAPTDAFWKGADGEIKTFEDIISKPDSQYWNRTGGARTTTDKDVLLSDYLKDWLIRHTQRVYHFEIDYRGKTKDSASNYIFRFKTKAAEGTPLMYAAGMRSFEFNTHRNDMQWYGLPSPKVTGADQTIEKGKEIRLEFTTKDNLAGFSLGDPKLGYNPATSITLEDSKLKLENQKVEVQKVSDYEHKLIITGRVASEPSDTGYQVKVKSVNNVGQSAEFTSTVKVTQSITPTLELNQDPKTGDVTVTPKKPDSSTYPSGTKVEIPGKDKDHPITVTIGEDGKGKVPNSDLPEGNVPGIGKITESGQPTVEVPDVTTPAKITPRDTTPPKIYWLKDDGSRQELGYTHAAGQNVVIPLYRGDAVNTRLITIDDSGKVTDFRLENLQSGFSFTPVNGTATEESPLGQNVTGKVGLEVKKGKYTARAISTDGTNSTTGYFVFDIHEQAEKYNPTGDTLTVNQGQPITDDAVKAKVKNYAPGTLTVESKPTSTATAGDAGNAVVKVTYPDGSSDIVNVPVTVKDVTGPTITAESATVTKNKPITPIPVTAVDNTGGVGMRDNNPIQVSNLPQGLKYENGQITGTTNAKTGFYTVKITAYDKNNTPSTKSIKITVQDQLAGTATGKTVPEKTPVPANTKVITPNKPGTTITVDNPVNGLTVDNGGNLVGTPTVDNWEPKEEEKTVEIPVKLKNGSEEVVVKVPITIERDTDGDGTPDKVDSDDDNDGIPDTEDANPKVADKLTGTVTEKTVPEKTPVPANTKVITPNKPGTTITTDKPVNGLTVDNGGNLVGTPTVTDWGPKEEEKTVEIPVKLKKGTEEVVVKVPVKIQRDTDGDGIPDVKDPDDDNDGIPDTEDANPKVADKLTGTVEGKTVPEKTPVPANTKVVTPNKPGTTITTDKPVNGLTVDNGGNLVGTPTVDNWEPKEEEKTVEIPVKLKKGTEEVVVKVPVKIQRDTDGDGIPDIKDPDDDNDGIPDKDEEKNGTDPKTPTTQTPTIEITRKPNGDVVVTPKKPGGETYPPGTKVVIPGENNTPIEVTIGDNGSGEVPNDKLPKTGVPGTGKITEPGKPAVEVPVETPAKVIPNTPRTEKPGKIEITRKPNGDAIVTPKKPGGGTYPPGTKVVIPGENNTPIEVTIGDNGSGEVPNDKLPKTDVPGTGKVTEPNKKPSQPVDVTTPARKTPTLDVDQDPKTGDVTVTPKKPDGSTFPPGTKVEIPGKDGNPIPVTIGEDGKGKVPNSDLPEGDVPGTGKITEPGKPAVEVPVETPAKVIPNTPRTEKPGKIEITRKPNGDAIVTPKKPDGSTYPSGSKVVIPGENNTPIEVTIGDNGSGEVPNDKLPKTDVPGTGKVTEPNKKPSQPVDVTTPARKTPTLDVDQDPKTGDVTVTPKKPDGSTFPPGTKVEIPGKDGNPIIVTIGEDGKGKVPNSDLPEGDVPGTGKITEPGKPAVEVPVETPAKVIPNTPRTEKPGKIEITRKPNGDAIVTPKKPDGSTYPSGSKVVIPGENNTPIPVTIGDNGSGEVPNDKLPKTDVPGTGKVTEPNKKPSQPVDVTTPARKTPTLDVDQDPKTGDVTVTPKKPDGSTFPPGTKVEIPGKDGNPIPVTIGEDGKGKVPNSDLPEGDVPGTGKITEPGKPAVEVPVETPAKVIPNTPRTEKPGKIEITRKPNGDAIVTPKKPDGSTYPSGSKVVIPGENNTPIEVTIGDNGSGEVPNDKLPKTDVPGTGKVTEPNKKPSQPVDVTTPARKTPTLDVDQDPKTGDVTVTPKKPDGSTFPPGTKVEIPGKDGNPIIVTIGEDGKGKVPNSDLPEGDVPGTGKITEPGKPAVEVPVETPAKVIPNTPRTEKPGKIEITRKPNGDAIVTPKKPDGSTYPSGSKVVIPGENNTPIPVTIGDNGSGEVPNDKLPKTDVPGTGKVTEPNKKPSQPVDVTTPARKTPTLDVDQDPKTGDVTVTPKKPDGSTFPPGTKVEIPGKDGNPIPVTIGEDGKGKVPNSDLPEGDVPGTGKITEPGKPAVEVPVETPAKVIPNTPRTEKPGKIEITRKPNGDAIVTPKKPDGSTYPSGSKVVIPGENNTPIPVTIGDNGSGEVPNDKLPKTDVPGTGKVTEPNKKPSQPVDVTTPARKTPTLDVDQDPKTGDVTVTPKKPDGSTFPPGTKVEIPGKDGNPIPVTIGEDGKGKVPNSDLPEGDVPGTGKITEPGKPAVEVPVETPAKVIPNTPRTEKPGKIEITRKPNGDAIVTPKKPDGSTYPSGSKVVIPGENNTPIEVTIGDNGSGEVPNDKLPKKDVPGTGKVTEPNKKPSQPVDVTTPARKTPTIELDQDPKTGDVTVTPKKPDGSTFPPGTKVEIPGKDGNPITVTIGEDGKGKVPNSDLPEGDVPGTGKITEPGKPAVEVPVETPAKVIPNTPRTEKPGKIEITRKPNGDAIVTPKKPDGSTYPSGSKVVIPGENNTPIEVTIGDNGSGEVPNDKLPKTGVPGTGKVTEPNKKPSQPVDVTTPARKTPTVDVDQDPKTGDVTVTPKKPDGSTFPPGTKVEIPGKDGNPIIVTIGEDGKGKVPNSDLPEGDVPGTGKITEPGKPAVEVPVETPAKVTPNTPRTEKPGKIEITRKPNGDAIVTPKKPDGSTYPSGSKVVIPGENNTPIEVTIGDNGSGEVPNDKLPKTDVPGTGKVTEPNKKPSQPVDVITPARKTPTIELDQDPKTGDVTVTPKKPDGSTFPPGTKVEIPGKDGNPITVTIGEDGKGKVPNSDLPEGDVPGTGKITEPGQPTVEVPVETPAKVTPNTPRTEKPVAPVTPDTNGDKSNDSQKVLPNTGTESNATLASLGLLGILGGLGLALGKKKED